MSRKVSLIGFAFLTLLCAADTATVNGITWTYTVANGVASVGSSSSTAVPQSTSGTITIPSRLGGYPVTSIGGSAFFGCDKLTSVTIPDGMTSIGWDAFANCIGLISVTIPDSVMSIEEFGFSSCTNLKDVKLGNGVLSIGHCAFLACSGLKNVTIPTSVTNISVFSFAAYYTKWDNAMWYKNVS